MPSLPEQLSSLPALDSLLEGGGGGEYLLGSAGEPWRKALWATYPGLRENGYGWYGRYDFAGLLAAAFRTGLVLPAVSGPKGVAASIHTRQLDYQGEAYFELWLYGGDIEGRRSGWRLAGYFEGEEPNLEVRLEFWFENSNFTSNLTGGTTALGVLDPSSFDSGPSRFALVVTGERVVGFMFNPIGSQWEELVYATLLSGETPEQWTNSILLPAEAQNLGIGGRNEGTGFYPTLSDLSYGGVSLEEEEPPPVAPKPGSRSLMGVGR